MAPCKKYWWTVLIYIHNFYPEKYDERCLPWTWYLSFYVQISLVLPLLLLVYKKTSTLISSVFFTYLFLAFFVLNYAQIFI